MMDGLSGSTEWFVQRRSDGEYGCWRPFINNKFFTYPKVYFLVYEVFYLLHLLHGFLLLSKHRKEIQTRRNGNYEKQITLEGISRYIGISESHLRRRFRRETGMTVVDYITRYRIEKAKRLLETGEYVIGEIYEKVGFSTSQYFSIVFKRYEKISPGQYQKKWSSRRE